LDTKKRLVRNTAANAGAQLLQMASGFVFMPFLLRAFGLESYGVFLLAGSFSGYLGLLDLGVGTSLVKYVAEQSAERDDAAMSRTISTAYVFYLCVGALAALTLVSLAYWGVDLLSIPAASIHLARTLFFVGAVAALVSWPASVATYVLAGLQQYETTARVRVGIVIAAAVGTTATIMGGWGPVALLIISSAIGLLGSAVCVLVSLRALPNVTVSLGMASWSTFRRILRFSRLVFFIQMFGMLFATQTDRLVLGAFIGPAAIALYEAAGKLQTLIQQLAVLVGSAVVPTASDLRARGKEDTLRELFLRGTKYAVIAVCPVAVTLIVLARPLLVAWLGPDFTSVTLGAQIFLSFWLLNANTTVAGSILVGIERLRFVLWYTIALGATNALLSIFLVQRIGLLGVIVGTVVPYYLGFPVYLWFVLRTLGVPARLWWSRVFWTCYPLLAVPALISGLCVWSRPNMGLYETAAVAAASVGSYWFLAFRLALTRGERADAHSLLRRFTARTDLLQA